jgi:hypothetical protein
MRRPFFGLMALAISLGGCEQSHKQIVTFTVESKERRSDSDGAQSIRCAYYVYGTNGEVFRNEDAIVFGEKAKFDSASMQALLHQGQTYTVETIGWRVPWASMSPNIVRIVRVGS